MMLTLRWPPLGEVHSMMRRENGSRWPLAASLSALVGYVDAIGLMSAFGFLASILARAPVPSAGGAPGGVVLVFIAAGLSVVFVLGVVLGSLVGHLGGNLRRPAVLVVVTVLLGGAALSNRMGLMVRVAAMALAMGAVNGVFEAGDLRVGRRSSRALGLFGQVRRSVGGLKTAVWMCAALGAVVGVLAYWSLSLDGLWIASAASALLAFLSATIWPKASRTYG